MLTGSYPNPGLASNVVGSQHIAEGAVGSSDLANHSVNAAKIVNGSIGINEIAGPPAWTPMPVLGNGWSATNAGSPWADAPLASYRDHLGRIWFSGTAERTSGDWRTIGCVGTVATRTQVKGYFSVPTGNNLDIPGTVQAQAKDGKLCLSLLHGSTDQVYLDGISIRE